MSYSPQLAKLIDSESELDYSSQYEVEIRAMTVIAVEKILIRIKQNEALSLKVKYAYQVDWLLWQMGESRLGKMRPHHRVLSIYY